MNNLLATLNKPIYKHLLFWVVVFLFYTTSARERFESIEELVITYVFHVLFQVAIAYTVLFLIIPQYKKNKNAVQAFLSVILLLFIIHFLYVSVRLLFLEPTYPDCYAAFFEKYGDLTFGERILDWKEMLFHLPLFYLQPLFFLGAFLAYEKQQKLTELSEQKKEIELKSLKHQLNPHFLFNTLNNLYTLSLEKSDTAPEIIDKLSGILDYMLYRCDDKYVSLDKEIELIENYLTLEQIRYEDRVSVSFKNSVDKSARIAPLLLLTFIENAFKHGVSQELNIATISLSICLDNNDILFTIANTKPQSTTSPPDTKNPIGLTNIQKQLELLYPNSHELTIEDTPKMYVVNLKLKQQ